MNLSIDHNEHWPNFRAQFEQLNDAQLTHLCQSDSGQLQAAWFMVGSALAPAEDGLLTLRKRVARAMAAQLTPKPLN